MKTVLLLSALIVSASLAPIAGAQTGASDDNVKASEPSDKYGPGGTHVTVSDKKYRVIAEIYRDKNGKKRESIYHGSPDGKIPPQTMYYDENEKLVVKVFHHRVSGDSYVDANGTKLDPTEAKALIAKLKKTSTGSAEKPEEHPKARPELPGGGTAPSLIPSAQTMPLEPAVVPSAFNWTGFYVGGQVGYARSQSDYSLKLGGLWELFPDEAEGIEEEGDHEFDEDGFGIGGCAGYNYQFQNRVVIGLGIAGRKYWKLSNEFETGDFPSGRSDFDVWSSFNTTGLVTFGPKIGYALGRFLPYVSGGLAFGELDASQKIFSSNFAGFREGEKASENRLGWNVSAGLQYAFTPNWSLRVEYSYTDLGTFKYPGRSEPLPTFRGFDTWHMATLTEHGGNFGIVYTFGSTTSASPH